MLTVGMKSSLRFKTLEKARHAAMTIAEPSPTPTATGTGHRREVDPEPVVQISTVLRKKPTGFFLGRNAQQPGNANAALGLAGAPAVRILALTRDEAPIYEDDAAVRLAQRGQHVEAGVAAIGHCEPPRADGSHETSVATAIDRIAKFPTIVATWDRMRRGLDPIAPDPKLTTAANFLYMRTGEKPIPEAEKALDTYLILLADHSYNASTFSARVTASTGADIYCSITAAVSTLAGDLHGGAPSKVMTHLEEIGLPEKAEAYVRDLLARHEKIMGMGHREYKIRDPRAAQLERMAKELTAKSNTKWYFIARALEDAADKVLREEKPGKRIYANVEFYTAPTLSSLGIPSDEFTCMFACGRIAGWTAHVLEQFTHNRLIRPQATYVGPAVHPYEPIATRHSQGTAGNGKGTLSP